MSTPHNGRRFAATLQRALIATLLSCTSVVSVRAVEPAAAPAAGAPDEVILKKYDKNKNGKLDPDEIASMRAEQGTTGDEPLQLSPFEVTAAADNSYNALESNSITRFRTELYKLPVTAQVFTEAFMRDVAVTSVEEMIINYGGSSVLSLDAGASGSFDTQPGDRVGSSGTPPVLMSRGMPLTVHRDGFISTAPTGAGTSGMTDSFSIERVDMTSGSNSLLYGNSGAGGVVNIMSKQARFRRSFGHVEFRMDEHGSKRGMLDYNWGNEKIAIRASFVNGTSYYRRDNLGGPTNGIYGQVALRLPFNSTLRMSHQNTNSFLINSSGNGNINNFLYVKDANGNIVRDANGIPTVNTSEPRRNLSLNLLTARGQVGDLNHVFSPGFNLENIDSFKGWWRSNWNRDDYSNVLLESSIRPWLTSQIAVSYDDAVQDNPNNANSISPRSGYPGAGNNPLPVTAISHTNPGDSLVHTRTFGNRASLLATNEFFGGKIKSQTLVGGEYTRRDGAQNGVAYSYFLMNADGSTFVNQSALNNGEYGRTRLVGSPTLWAPVQDGLNKRPFFKPMTPVIEAINPATGRMEKWVREQRRRLNPALVSPSNPLGADRTGSGEYNVGHTVTHAYYIANVSDWYDGKIQTLAGVRWVSQLATNIGPNAMTSLPKTRKLNYTAGVSYQLLPWLRPFVNVSSAHNPSAQPNDPLGTPVRPPSGQAAVPDFGVKFRLMDARVQGSITYYPGAAIKDDRANIDNSYRDAINPDGINGRFLGVGGGFQGTINVDKESKGLDANVTMQLRKNWVTRLDFHMTDGTFNKTVSYPQVYNDEFHLNSSGEVTYGAGGPTVMVNPTTGAVVTSGGSPLTLAMINSSGALTANPDPDSGRIQNTTLRNALRAVGPNGASAATGRTGLPIDSIQYTWTDPNGHDGVITPIFGGDKTIGYPQYTFSFTNRYEFESGALKGLGIITTANANFKYRSHYYPVYGPGQTPGTTRFSDLSRELYLRPTIATVNLGVSYKRKFGRYTYTTQVNVNNLFNHYKFLFPPNATGANPPVNTYVVTTEPRLWIWTNSVSF